MGYSTKHSLNCIKINAQSKKIAHEKGIILRIPLHAYQTNKNSHISPKEAE